jgi:hypothetical protein
MEQQKRKTSFFCLQWNILRPPAGRRIRERGGPEDISMAVKTRGFLNLFLFHGIYADRLYGLYVEDVG